MSGEQENPEGSPRPKRSRSSKPLQTLSLPTRNSQKSRSRSSSIQQSKSQTTTVAETHLDDEFRNSDAGVIKKINLTNFMCHGNFEIELNPRINFISGVNGSGKSAIQTAIAIGLGGTASKTNRSSKLVGLIKHGCNTGSITITLANVGTNAFKPEEYGQEIRVIRNITPSSSTYRLFNQWGKLISNKKQELDTICTKFRIQPNNPVSILNQDMARNFLSTNKAENKYSMFKKATLLETAEISLNNISVIIADQKEELQIKQRAAEQNDADMAHMAEKFELVEKLKESKDRFFQLTGEFAWGEAYALRDEVERLEATCTEQEERKNEATTELEKIKAEIAEKESKIEELSHTISQLQTETRTKEETIQKSRLEYRRKKAQYEEKCEEYQRVSRNIKNKKSDKQSIQTSLDDIERDEAEQKTKREEAQMAIVELNKQITESEDKVKKLNEEISMLRNTASQFYVIKKEKEKTIYQLHEGIKANERQMGSLKNSEDLSVYGHWMSNLVRKIDEAVKQGRFSKPPRGPMGQYMKVKHEKWTDAIENNLGGGFLSSFLVNTSADRIELYKIMNQVVSGSKPTVHCTAFQERRIDISKIEAKHENYFNMFRALTINDPVVSNFVLDYRSIHTILLVEEDAVCRSLYMQNDFIPNCKAIINLKADSYEAGCKFYSNFRPHRSRLLQKSMAHQMRSLQEEVAEQKAAIAREQGELEQLVGQQRSVQRRLDEMNNIHQKYSKEKNQIQREISEKKSTIDMEMPSLQAKIEEMNSIDEEIANLEARKQKLQQEQEETASEMRRAKELMDQCGGTDTIVKQSQLSSEVEKYNDQVGVLRRRMGGYEKKIEEVAVKINLLKRRINETREKFQSKTDEASQVSQQPETEERKTIQELKHEINLLKEFIQQAERRLGAEPVDFQTKYLHKKKQQDEFKKNLSQLRKMHMRFRDMWTKRKTLTEGLRDVLSNVIFANFQTVLGSRNYRGKLQFDHNKGKLDILMAPPDSGENFMNTESLSGGEKSVSTVAFLMALWSNMDLPFYSMDEYDVFMDAINRRTITGLLTSFASDKTTRQFIFLTPLDVSLIQTGPSVAVHRVNKIM